MPFVSVIFSRAPLVRCRHNCRQLRLPAISNRGLRRRSLPDWIFALSVRLCDWARGEGEPRTRLGGCPCENWPGAGSCLLLSPYHQKGKRDVCGCLREKLARISGQWPLANPVRLALRKLRGSLAWWYSLDHLPSAYRYCKKQHCRGHQQTVEVELLVLRLAMCQPPCQPGWISASLHGQMDRQLLRSAEPPNLSTQLMSFCLTHSAAFGALSIPREFCRWTSRSTDRTGAGVIVV